MDILRKSLVLFSVFLLMLAAGPASGQEQSSEEQTPAAEAAPEVTGVTFDPANPATGAKLKVRFKYKEPAVQARVKWTVNDEDLGSGKHDGIAAEAQLDKDLKEGDVVKVEIIPFDGGGSEGQPVTKSVTIANAPPDMQFIYGRLEGEVYRAKVEAKDPEGGPVTFTVEGPEGMKIDQKGNITWKLRPRTTGSFDIRVVAKDDKGLETVLTYSIGLRR